VIAAGCLFRAESALERARTPAAELDAANHLQALSELTWTDVLSEARIEKRL
jgi:hypothetical protein